MTTAPQPLAEAQADARMDQLHKFVEWERATHPGKTHIAEWALYELRRLRVAPPVEAQAQGDAKLERVLREMADAAERSDDPHTALEGLIENLRTLQPHAEAQAQGGGEVLDRGFKFESGVHTPTVLVGFAPNDWKARDAFAASITTQASPPSAPVGVSRYVRDEQGRMMRDGKPEPQISYGTGWNACLDALAQQPTAIPRLANCGRYTATDNIGQHYYLNHANTWQAFQGQQPAAVGVEDIIEAFDEITGLCRHLRQGGPAPEDLHGLSGALDEAIGIAGDMLAALAQAPASGEAVAPFGYCADFETGLYECSHKFYYLAPGQPVPEGCTPFYTTPPAPVPAIRVTDEMVEAALAEFRGLRFPTYPQQEMRAALEAALGQGKESE